MANSTALAALLCTGMLLFLTPAAKAQSPDLRLATHDEILTAVRSSEARVKVVNFWATWCLPCRQEFPHFVQIGRDFASKGVEVIFVSADLEEDRRQATSFLAEQKVSSPTYIIKGDPNEFIDAFYEGWSGALPATFLYGPDGSLETFWEGQVTPEQLEEGVTRLLEASVP